VTSRARRIRRLAFTTVLVTATTAMILFLFLPIMALFLRVPPMDLVRALGEPVARDAMIVTLQSTLIAQVIIVVVGTPAAYLIATRRFPGRTFIVTLTELPLVLPPAVAGLALLAVFGRLGLLGGTLETLGIQIPFTQVAVVMAITFVASPFYLRQAIAAFGEVDTRLLDAARTLGAGPGRVFVQLALPLAGRGLAAGAALAFGRGVGEFGATIMFAGSMQGVTQTLSLAIYSQFDVNFDVALALGAVMVAISAAILLTAKFLPQWLPSSSTSHSPAVGSPSV